MYYFASLLCFSIDICKPGVQLIDCIWQYFGRKFYTDVPGTYVDDHSHLNEDGRQLLRCAKELQDLSDGSEEEFVSANVALRLCDYRKKLLSFLQGTLGSSVPQPHIFVLMISPEQRNRKPYALPVQCIPYASLKHKTCRKLVNDLITEMHNRHMKVAGKVLSTRCQILFSMLGFTTDGKFNSLRCSGYTWPLSVLQLRANSRAKYGAMKLHKILQLEHSCACSTDDVECFSVY